MVHPTNPVAAARLQLWRHHARQAVQQAEDAQAFTDEIVRIAEAYPPGAVNTSREDRERHFSPAQRLAWCIRFTPGEGELHAACQEAASYLQDAML